MWASGCEYCLATDSLVVSVITLEMESGSGGRVLRTGGSSSLLNDKIRRFKALTTFIKTSGL